MKKTKIYALNNGINSISFFKKAFEEGAVAVQCDIRRTLDGQFIALRDRTLSKLCGRDWVVSGTSWAHIKNLPVRSGEPIPHLDDILKFMILRPVAKFFFRVFFSSARDISDLAHQISKAGIQDRIFITLPAGRASLAQAAKKSAKGIGTAIFSSWPSGLAAKASRYGMDKICLLSGGFPASSVFLRCFESFGTLIKQADLAKEEGIEFSIGAVNGPNTLRRAIQSGAEAVWAYDVAEIAKLLK
ncbi:MAG: hypothetical protein J5706_07235 [Elusimicrobiales bacterium]|nr:hypothetical protein [Elusimicrobiales bacterium]